MKRITLLAIIGIWVLFSQAVPAQKRRIVIRERPSKIALKTADQYLCVAEDVASGFQFSASSGKWRPTTFPSGRKYLISKNTKGDFYVRMMGMPKDQSIVLCGPDFGPAYPLPESHQGKNILFCQAPLHGTTFTLNANKGTFLYTSAGVSVPNLDAANLVLSQQGDIVGAVVTSYSLEIGKCSPF